MRNFAHVTELLKETNEIVAMTVASVKTLPRQMMTLTFRVHP